VGPDGVDFRGARSSVLASSWKAEFVATAPGGRFREDAANPPKTVPADKYFPGDRELRVVLQREADQGPGEGRHRIVLGRVNTQKQFEPALVVYDYPPTDTTRGFMTVEVCGDLHVRGTAFLHSVRKSLDSPDQSEQLTMLLTLLAGPLGGALQAFLTSDPQWLSTFAQVMAVQMAQSAPAPVRTAFINALAPALAADATFQNAVMAPAVTAAVNQANAAIQTAITGSIQTNINTAKAAALAEMRQDPNLVPLLAALAAKLDVQGGRPALPNDPAAALLIALFRHLLYDPFGPTAFKNLIAGSMDAGDQATIRNTALDWL
jgi:hypothetical protein